MEYKGLERRGVDSQKAMLERLSDEAQAQEKANLQCRDGDNDAVNDVVTALKADDITEAIGRVESAIGFAQGLSRQAIREAAEAEEGPRAVTG